MTQNVGTENIRRAKIRRTLLAVGTPLLLLLFAATALIANTLLNTMDAVSESRKPNSSRAEVFSTVEKAAFTAPFMEGYVARYNFATALAEADPTRINDAVMIYLETIPSTPPHFICYPVLNAVYYSELLGDDYASLGAYDMAELYYNYAEHYIGYAPQCMDSPPNGDGDGQGQSGEDPDEGEGSDDEKQSEAQEKMDELEKKQEAMREAQGKPKQADQSGSQKEREESVDKETSQSEQTQKETEQARKEEAKGEQVQTPSVDRPW